MNQSLTAAVTGQIWLSEAGQGTSRFDVDCWAEPVPFGNCISQSIAGARIDSKCADAADFPGVLRFWPATSMRSARARSGRPNKLSQVKIPPRVYSSRMLLDREDLAVK